MTHFISSKVLIPLVFISPFLFLPSLFHVEPAIAADCINQACIDVYAQDGQIIIEGRKGNTAKAKPAKTHIAKPKPQPTRVLRPKVVRTVKPIPKKTAPPKPRVVLKPKAAPRKKVAPRPVPRKKVAPQVRTAVSLNDRLVKLLPLALIARQPVKNAIVNVPVIYWCNLPQLFMTRVAIVGEVIDVTMRPSFLWSFGDGSFFATTKAGAAFPHQVISHAYNHSGTFLVTMLATWGGTWTHNGVARAITGEVRKVSVATINVANAPTRITG